jgi:hypothetical protein
MPYKRRLPGEKRGETKLWRSCVQLLELPHLGARLKQRSNLHITNDVRCSASGGSSLTHEAEIGNESSLSTPACEIPPSPIHRYPDFTMKILVAFVLPLVALGFAIVFAY